MAQPPKQRRYIVNNIGHGFAVHDTQVPYERLSGEDRGGVPSTTNAFTSRMIEIFPTRITAQRYADELNAKHEALSA